MPHPEFLAGQILPASQLAALAVRDTYTPTLTATVTDPDVGTFGLISGTYCATGGLVTVAVAINFGTSGVSAGSGIYELSLPPEYPLDLGVYGFRHALGTVTLRDESASNTRYAITIAGNGSGRVRFAQASATTGAFVQNNNPWTWSTSDQILAAFSYLAEE